MYNTKVEILHSICRILGVSILIERLSVAHVFQILNVLIHVIFTIYLVGWHWHNRFVNVAFLRLIFQWSWFSLFDSMTSISPLTITIVWPPPLPCEINRENVENGWFDGWIGKHWDIFFLRADHVYVSYIIHCLEVWNTTATSRDCERTEVTELRSKFERKNSAKHHQPVCSLVVSVVVRYLWTRISHSTVLSNCRCLCPGDYDGL